VRNLNALSKRSGVLRSPSRLGSSPMILIISRTWQATVFASSDLRSLLSFSRISSVGLLTSGLPPCFLRIRSCYCLFLGCARARVGHAENASSDERFRYTDFPSWGLCGETPPHPR